MSPPWSSPTNGSIKWDWDLPIQPYRGGGGGGSGHMADIEKFVLSGQEDNTLPPLTPPSYPRS